MGTTRTGGEKGRGEANTCRFVQRRTKQKGQPQSKYSHNRSQPLLACDGPLDELLPTSLGLRNLLKKLRMPPPLPPDAEPPPPLRPPPLLILRLILLAPTSRRRFGAGRFDLQKRPTLSERVGCRRRSESESTARHRTEQRSLAAGCSLARPLIRSSAFRRAIARARAFQHPQQLQVGLGNATMGAGSTTKLRRNEGTPRGHVVNANASLSTTT
uniref:Uncharacterized protein n=1 Tax=Plectus sambesii TaxID=2011161 RepID=A0A914WHG7_9BILA